MQIQIEDIKIDLKMTDSDAKEKAIVTLKIDPIEIKGFRILSSNFSDSLGEGLWLAEPSYQSRGGKWNKEFYCEDEKLYEEIKKKVFEEFYSQKKRQETPIIE